MRIALMSETFLPDVNGVTRTICHILDHLQAEGHRALLFAPWGAPGDYAGFEVVPLTGVPLPMYPDVKFTPPQFGITAHLQRFKPDLLHLVGPIAFGTVAPTIAHNLRLPIISSYHTDFGAYTAYYGLGVFKNLVNFHMRWIHNRTRITLCPSTATLRYLRSHGFRRLKVWGRGVDIERFQPAHHNPAWRESVGAQPGEMLLLYVGRLAREKRVDLLADALRGLQGVRLVLVGGGPARAELEQRMHGLPVHFTGFLQGHALATAYASADAFVFPSHTDTFGQVVQEAMASGLPVVGARSGGTLDLVREGVTGLLFEPGAATDLRAQLLTLIRDPATRLAMGEAGHAAAMRRSWPRIMAELMRHYDHVLRRAPQSSRWE
jgi:glycosyltransferase involved in cell wall biosynthesis